MITGPSSVSITFIGCKSRCSTLSSRRFFGAAVEGVTIQFGATSALTSCCNRASKRTWEKSFHGRASKIFEHRGAVDSLHQNVAISKVFWAKVKHRWNSDSLTGDEPHHADLISGVWLDLR